MSHLCVSAHITALTTAASAAAAAAMMDSNATRLYGTLKWTCNTVQCARTAFNVRRRLLLRQSPARLYCLLVCFPAVMTRRYSRACQAKQRKIEQLNVCTFLVTMILHCVPTICPPFYFLITLSKINRF